MLVIAISVVGAAALLTIPRGGPEAQFVDGPETEEFYVWDAQATSDGKGGLFSFNQVFQRQARPEVLVSGKYRLTTRGIAHYDLESGRITVIHRRPGPGTTETGWGSTAWGYGIVGICWDKVLVASDEGTLHWLDMKTGSLTRTALREEWAAMGITVTHYWVIDRQGTIALWARPPAQALSDPRLKMVLIRHLWVRRPSGKYADGGLFRGVHMLDDNRFLITSPFVAPHSDGYYVLYSIETGARKLSDQEGSDLERRARFPSYPSYWCSGANRQVHFGRPQGRGGALSLPRDRLELWRRGTQEWITIDVKALRTALGS